MTPSLARTAGTALGVVAAVGAAAFAYGSIVERNRFTIRRESVPVLDPGARALTVLHISDLHMAPWQDRKQRWVRSLARLEPDLIINTGDNLGHPDGLEGLEKALRVFEGVPGVYVHGSNDVFGPQFKNPFTYFGGPSRNIVKPAKLDTERMERFFETTLDWVSLNNAAHALEIHGSRLELFGTNDAHRNWDRLETLPGAIEDMRENTDWDDTPGSDPVAIGVTHAPYRRVLDSFVNHGAEVIFAGHTHGGQVRIPGLAALVTNCDIPREQAQGVSVWSRGRRSAFLEVSAGIGTSIYAPVRFACPPEAVVVTLAPGDFSYS